MRAGDLRERVTIQDKSVVQDGYGAEVISWTTVGTFWAAVEPLAGREFLEGRQMTAEVTTRIRIRRQDATVEIRPEMQAVYRGRTFEIVAVLELKERRREMHLMCTEAV